MNKIKITIDHNLYHYSGLKDYIHKLKDILEEIPVEYQNEAIIDIENYEEYGNWYLTTSIYYLRKKTPLEKRKQHAQEIRDTKEKELKEKKQFKRLLKKYGEIK
jgi:predicted GTPase